MLVNSIAYAIKDRIITLNIFCCVCPVIGSLQVEILHCQYFLHCLAADERFRISFINVSPTNEELLIVFTHRKIYSQPKASSTV